MTYTYTKNTLTILSGYKTRKRDMRPDLVVAREQTNGETSVFERSIFSLKMEWICHNFLYNIGYKREQTKDVDLDNPADHPEWLYILCGLLVWIFVW